MHFYGPPDLGGLAARLQREYTVIQVCQKHKFHQYGFSGICMVAMITENPYCQMLIEFSFVKQSF